LNKIADYLQVSKEKIYKMCQRGKIPASKIGGNGVLILKITCPYELVQFMGRTSKKTG